MLLAIAAQFFKLCRLQINSFKQFMSSNFVLSTGFAQGSVQSYTAFTYSVFQEREFRCVKRRYFFYFFNGRGAWHNKREKVAKRSNLKQDETKFCYGDGIKWNFVEQRKMIRWFEIKQSIV